jgi:protein required for attachment to host cells
MEGKPKAMHWVVVGDAAHVRIFEGDQGLDVLVAIEAFGHPETRGKASDLVSGARGRSRTFQGEHTALERHTDPHRATVHAFAREVAERIAVAHEARAFERVILVAPPQFLGELRATLGDLGGAVVATINKDWAQVPTHELPGRLRVALSSSPLLESP